MTAAPRVTILLGLLLLAAAAGCVLAARQSFASRQAAERAAASLAETRSLAGRIIAAQQSTTEAGGQDRWLDIPTRIKHAATAAGISDAALTTISPGEPRRLGRSDYSEVPVPLAIESVSARQLMTFLHVLSRPEVGLTVHRARMTRSGGAWNADVTVTYPIYTPERNRRS